MEEERRARHAEEGASPEKKDRRARKGEKVALRGAIQDVRTFRTPRKGSLLPSPDPEPSRFLDFRVFSNPRTENSWAGSASKDESGGKRTTRRKEGYSLVPFSERTLFPRRATPERSLRLHNGKEKIVRDDISRILPLLSTPFHPSFLFPTPRARLFSFSSSRDANFFQNDGTPPLPDYQKLPAVFSLEIFGSRQRSSFPPFHD